MFAHFTTIDYLQQGNPRQQAAWQVLTESKLFTILQAYSPKLAGTMPIEIDIPGSDLDVICCFEDAGSFAGYLKTQLNHYPEFVIRHNDMNGIPTVIANFFLPEFEVEIFGQPRPVEQQEAWKHMLVEYKLLQKHGESFRQQVIDLKLKGIKTEPAFAKLLGLQGDPYEALLDLYNRPINL